MIFGIKKLKEPKRFKKPRVYYQPGDNLNEARIRIIYPDDTYPDWFELKNQEKIYQELVKGKLPRRLLRHTYFGTPCWHDNNMDTGPKCLRAMRQFDYHDCNWNKAIYLGEL